MANENETTNSLVRFATGSESNLPASKIPGKILFAIDSNDHGYIYFDKDAETRIKMSALSAQTDTSGNNIKTYIRDVGLTNDDVGKQLYFKSPDNSNSVVIPGTPIEYIVGSQTSATNAWKGTTKESALYKGKVIAYKLPYAGNSSAATLTLTLADGTPTQAISLKRKGTGAVTTHYSAGEIILLIYDGTNWQVNGEYDANNYVTQTLTTGNVEYAVLFSSSAAGTTATKTEGARKNGAIFKYNPSTGTVYATNFEGLASRATADGDGNSIKSNYITSIALNDSNNHEAIFQKGVNGSGGSSTLSLPFVKLDGDTMTGNLTISNSSPLLKIINSAGSNVAIELFRQGNAHADWKIINDAGTFKIQSDYTNTVGDYFNVLTLAYSSGNATFKGTVSASNGTVPTNGTPNLIGLASRAVADSSGNNIKSTYVASIEVNGTTLVYKNANNVQLGSLTLQDTDTKVTNTLATTTKAYITGTTSNETNTGTQVFDTGVYLGTAAGSLTATGAVTVGSLTTSGTVTANTLQGNLAWSYLTSVPTLVSSISGTTATDKYTIQLYNPNNVAISTNGSVTIPAASTTQAGLITSTDQTFTGIKNFSGTATQIGRNLVQNDTDVPGQGDILFTVFGYKNGYPIYTDPLFESGVNSVEAYNNSNNGNVTITRDTYTNFGITSPGTDSDYVLKIQNTGAASPDLGGFYQRIGSRANAQFVQIFRALIPVGYSLLRASNSMGNQYADYWITDNKGTGKWEWYARRILCGKDGSFSLGGHVALSGTPAGTASAPVVFYLGYCQLYDLTKAEYDGLRTRYADNADAATLATKATGDGNGNTIISTYLKSVTISGNDTTDVNGSAITAGSKGFYTVTTGANVSTKAALPIASATVAGIVTNTAQTWAGTKTFSAGVTVSGGYFCYSAIATGTSAGARPVWFSYLGQNGTPVIDASHFNYNPSTQTLTVANLSGTALKASQDANGQTIASTYLTQVYMVGNSDTDLSNSDHPNIVAGSKCFIISKSNSIDKYYLEVPVASETVAGIVNNQPQTWAGIKTFKTGYNQLITGGTGTEGNSDNGATGQPSKWSFNINFEPQDGDIIMIKVPVGGSANGVYLSTQNGANNTYYPIVVMSNGDKLTTHYAIGSYIQLVFQASGPVNSIAPLNGGARATSNNIKSWRVINFYNTNTTYSGITLEEIRGGGVATNRLISAATIAGAFREMNGTGLSMVWDSSGIKLNHTNSVTAGTASGTASSTLTFGGSFTIPTVSYDAQGHITGKGTTTLTLPANPNTDTRVTNVLKTNKKGYITATEGNADNTGTQIFDTGVFLTTNPGELQATTFVGALNGNAATASLADKATLLAPVAATTTTATSTWDSVPSGSYLVWGQKFSDTRLTYTPSGGSATTVTDTGDILMFLTPDATTNKATLNIKIDGSFHGNLQGNAATSTKWTSAQTVYVTLGTASTTTTIQGGSSTAQTIGVNGILGIANGGTGTNTFQAKGIVYAASTSQLTNTGAGTANQVLISGGSSGNPTWTNQSALSVGAATTATKFSSTRTIALTGDVTGSATGDGSSGWSIDATVTDNSHEHTRDTIVPFQRKVYSDVIATAKSGGAANGHDNCAFYFIKVSPSSYNDTWYIKYRIIATTAGVSATNGSGSQESIVEIHGTKSTCMAYRIWNNVLNASYRSYYYNMAYYATSTGISNNYGHALGVSLLYAYNPTTANNKRTITVEILDQKRCSISLLDTPVLYANWTGTGTTNYVTQAAYDGITLGVTETGDRNDVNYYHRYQYAIRTTSTALYRYQICLSKIDKSLLPINTSNNVVATNKTLTTESFDPFGDIYYWNSTTTYNANGNVGDGALYDQLLCDLRYSFNVGGYDVASTLVARKPLYLVAKIQLDGTAKLNATTPLTQTLPTSSDGNIYIYLGQVYPDTYPYRLYLTMNHPIYMYTNGGIQQYTEHSRTSEGLIGLNTYWEPQNATNDRPANINVNFHDNKLRYFIASTGIISDSNGKPPKDLRVLHMAWDNTGYDVQLGASGAQDLYIRSANSAGTFTEWKAFLNELNFNSYAPKLDGTGATGDWGINITGNAATATKFASAQSITLTGDTTGTVSSQAGWSIATTTSSITSQQLTNQNLNDIKTTLKTNYYYSAGSNNVINNPMNSSTTPDTNTGLQFGMYTYASAGGHVAQELSGYGTAENHGKWIRWFAGTSWSPWEKFITSSGGTFTGAVTGTSFAASDYIAANINNSNSTGGISLWGNNPAVYGIAMRSTGTASGQGGPHGYVTGNWAIYSYMNGSVSDPTDVGNAINRGWIFKNVQAATNVASISGGGNAVFNGSVTVGGNEANTSGCRVEYNSTLDTVNFVFV